MKVCLAIVFCIVSIEHALCQSPTTPQKSNEDLRELSEGFRRSVEPVLPAVVTVEVLRGPRNLPKWPQENLSGEVDRSHNRSEQDLQSEMHNFPGDGTGSGIIFDRRGYVLTCHHVVESADTVFVRLADGRRTEAIAILSDPVTDLAVIQIRGDEPLPVVPIGNSDELQIGDWVASIGNPYELGLSISAGIVSATDRHLPTSPRTHLLQTDAASNPGNSGGALVNLQGQVVGISEGGYGSHEGFQGIGFAIPINAAMKTAKRLVEQGEVSHIRLDFDTEPLEAKVANYLGIEVDSGLLVCDVQPNTPVAEAGISVGDVVTQIAGTPIHKSCDLVTAIEDVAPGEPLPIKLYRAGEVISIEFVPQSLQNNGRLERQHQKLRLQATASSDFEEILKVDEISAIEIKKLGFEKQHSGVLVTSVSPGSTAAKEGICAGMMVLRIGNQTVRTTDDYQQAMKSSRNSKGVLMLVATPHQQHFVLLQE